MINTILNTILTPTTVATLPPEVPAIVQTYNWQTQTSEITTNTPGSLPTGYLTYSFAYLNGIGKPPAYIPDDNS